MILHFLSFSSERDARLERERESRLDANQSIQLTFVRRIFALCSPNTLLCNENLRQRLLLKFPLHLTLNFAMRGAYT